MSDQIKQALCCVCGALRTCRRPRNYRRENRWLLGPVDRDWSRETGELKCEACGEITVHAIITGSDHAEEIHKVAIGWTLNAEADDRIRARWRQGRPENPYLHHIWWRVDEQEAREAGRSHFLALCKASVPVPRKRPDERDWSISSDELVAPSEFHDVDREDPATGLWWYDIDCVDCLRRSNAITLSRQRKLLKEHLAKVVEKIDTIDPQTVSALLAQLASESEVR